MENVREEFVENFQVIKNYLLVLNLTKTQFLNEIKNNTPIGARFFNFFKSIAGERGVDAEIREFVKIMYCGRENLGISDELLFDGIEHPEEVKKEIIARAEKLLDK